MNSCPKKMKREEIFMEFGKGDMDKCNSCHNLKYKDGMITCSILEEGEDDNEN
jgi:hypothetical protein